MTTRVCPDQRRSSTGAVLLLAVLSVLLPGCRGTDASDGQLARDGRRIRHIMPWPAGSASDVAMRGFLSYLEPELGARIYTENIAGGISARGLLRTRMAPPDGLTLGTMTYDVLTVDYFDLVPVSWTDFDILGMITEHPSVLISRSDRWHDLPAFRAEAGAAAGPIRIGNVGTGGVFHQHATALEQALGARFVHVPYSATSGQLSALLGGEVDAVVASLPVALPYVRQGSLRVLGVMAPERHPLLRDAPTFVEAGLDLVFGSFRMLVVPKGLDERLRARLEQGVERAWQDSTFQRWAARSALGATWRNPEESRLYLERLAPQVTRLMDRLWE